MAIQSLVLSDEWQCSLPAIPFARVWEPVSMDVNSITRKRRRKLSAKLLPHSPAVPSPHPQSCFLLTRQHTRLLRSENDRGLCSVWRSSLFICRTSHLRSLNDKETKKSFLDCFFSRKYFLILLIHYNQQKKYMSCLKETVLFCF